MPSELAHHEGPLPAGLATLAAPGTGAALWDNGPRWWLVEAASAAQLRSLRPDFAGIAAWSNATASTGVAVFAFEDGADHQLAVRAFCPGDAVNVPEDPVTGSANAAIAACLHRQGRLPGGGPPTSPARAANSVATAAWRYGSTPTATSGSAARCSR